MNYKCIIFDCDGILVDSEKISNRVLIEMAKELGLDIDIAYAETNFTGTALKSVFNWIEEQSGKKLPANFEKEFRKRTFELFATDLQSVKGIRQVLDTVSVPICVASNGPLEKIKLNLTVTKLIDKFGDNIYSAYQIGSWKPSPKLFQYAAKNMGFEPKDCLVIEDSIAGIKAAKSGGFRVYGYTNDRNRKTFEDAGAIVFNKMEDLLELIKK